MASSSQEDPTSEVSSEPLERSPQALDKQIEVLMDTAASFERAAKAVPAPLAKELRQAQRDVAEKRHQAQINEVILRLRVR